MKDLNDFYLQKENIKSELKLLEKEENEGMEKLEKNYLLEKKRIRDQFDQKKEKLWKEEDEIEKKIRSLTGFIFQENAQKQQENPSKNIGELPRKKGKKQIWIKRLLINFKKNNNYILKIKIKTKLNNYKL